MFVRLNDLEAMFREIEMIYKKYGMPKGMGFVPDKLEIVLERKEIDNFDLTYSEFFNYLPYHALNMAIGNVIHFMRQMGFPLEKIVRMENGVKVQISGDFRVAFFPIIEIISQYKDNETDIEAIFDSISKTRQLFTRLLDFHWDWNDETESKFNNLVKILYELMREHPSISEELEAVIKKYTAKKS